ncbi:hypothetical protein I204_06653 [Kwoniella mangroviensis CBS 8886]|uniref:uncharacterized protein n=1 Tax=Kwoniella mangroviensis CBS 8507 TaxID=1296122 RepID=UPI00080D1765|nr:uncharacterized protein I203_01375 [Kwoniella mangroviensis CBS 8507]OCF69516.1 hypothetical protein I203_01375 [Kwoniella mangroviensis CBS 8507]OCF72276.1 hypothetical protein I204_06653 [Kwoniella mangroviensis CBS 8886]
MTPTRYIATIYSRPTAAPTEGLLLTSNNTTMVRTRNKDLLHRIPVQFTPFPLGLVSPVEMQYNSFDITQVCGMAHSLSRGYLQPPKYGGFYPRPEPFSQWGNTAIFCGGINTKIHHGILKRVFGVVGEIDWIQTLHDGSSAMIKFRYPLDAERALWSLQGLVVDRRELRLNYGNPKIRHVPATPPPSPASVIYAYRYGNDGEEMIDSNGDSTDRETEGSTSGGGSPYRYLAELSPEFDEVVSAKWISRECPFGAIEQPSL